MSKSFESKSVLITGAASGIGRCAALEFARQGAKIVVADRNVEAGTQTVHDVQQLGAESVFVETDVADRASIENLIAQSVDKFGAVDYAINNAGVELEWAPLAEADEAQFDQIIAVNLKGVWLSMKYQIRQMLKQGNGAIVNTASIAAMAAAPNMSAYAASKHGVIGLTKTVAVEYASAGIRINAVCPGVIDTEMTQRAVSKGPQGLDAHLPGIHPMGRIGTAEEVVAAMIWLCSDAASFTTGAILPVEGGRLAR